MINHSAGRASRRVRVARRILGTQTVEYARLQDRLNAFLGSRVKAVQGVPNHPLAFAEPGQVSYWGQNLNPHQTRSVLQAIRYFLGEQGIRTVGPPRRAKEWPNLENAWIIPIGPLPDVETVSGYRHLKNPVMAEKFRKREAIDVDRIGFEVEPDVWRLSEFVDNVDYASSKHERWIYSIGRNKETGEYYAALDTRFYTENDPESEWETVWLR